MGNVHMEAAQINYRGGQKKMSVEEALKNTSGEAAAIAQLQQDVSDLNDVKANKITIAPAFSAEASYDPGDLVYYNGLTYRCVNAHSGEWDADDFAATTIDNELSELRSGLITLHGYTDISASVVDPSLSFTATENCILWLCSSNAENVAPYYNYLVNNTRHGLKGGVGATLDHYVFLRAGDVFKFNDSFPYESTLTNNVYLV